MNDQMNDLDCPSFIAIKSNNFLNLVAKVNYISKTSALLQLIWVII